MLTLYPGNFWDPLVGFLDSVTFSTKPKYLALSYMWRDPDSEHASIPAMPGNKTGPAESAGNAVSDPVSDAVRAPESYMVTSGPGAETARAKPPKEQMEEEAEEPYITINGARLALFHNVCLALRFLRSKTHKIDLWVDAICIDQQSIPERNSRLP